MQLSVIIVNYNVKYFLEVCLCSVFRAMEGIQGEVIVVDNHSSDGSTAMLREQFPQVRLVANTANTGFSKANNQGVSIAQGTYLLFLNPDTVLPEDFFKKMLGYMDAHPEAGAIGPRLIDGKGQFAPDAKKSFPSFSVALFKGTGLHRLFPRSSYFNRYYAVHVGEHELAEVEVLSGCCMMVRTSVIRELGTAFDERFFMYFEDGDLCYRIKEAGYRNMYVPETTVIHYKGESTRKATLSYVRIFNEALSLFVRKHYSRKHASLFIALIHVGIFLKAILSIIRITLKHIGLPLLDALIIFLALWLVKDVYIVQVRDMKPVPSVHLFLTLPVYTLIWVLSLYLNGAYDQPFRAFRVVRGMLIGTILCLTYFVLLSPEIRYSRAVIVFSGAVGGLLVLFLHEWLPRIGVYRRQVAGELPGKAVIVGDEVTFEQTRAILARVPSAPDILGRIDYQESHTVPHTAIAPLSDMKPLLLSAGIREVIFCINGLSFRELIRQMEHCGSGCDYKIHLPGSNSFVGSNSSHTAGDLYTADMRYNLSGFASQRNKRMLDMGLSIVFIVIFPLIAYQAANPFGLLRNSFLVLIGQYTWVGYAREDKLPQYLPHIRPGILPPWNIIPDFHPEAIVRTTLNQTYAREYTAAADLQFVLKNFRFSGQKPGKDFAEK